MEDEKLVMRMWTASKVDDEFSLLFNKQSSSQNIMSITVAVSTELNTNDSDEERQKKKAEREGEGEVE